MQWTQFWITGMILYLCYLRIFSTPCMFPRWHSRSTARVNLAVFRHTRRPNEIHLRHTPYTPVVCVLCSSILSSNSSNSNSYGVELYIRIYRVNIPIEWPKTRKVPTTLWVEILSVVTRDINVIIISTPLPLQYNIDAVADFENSCAETFCVKIVNSIYY